MTAPRSPDHLADEFLSDLLEDERSSDAHLAGCAVCTARFRALGMARDALRTAAVAPLPPSVVDDLVAGALAARTSGIGTAPAEGRSLRAGPVPPSPGDRRARRIATPPPAWLLGAAAALAVVVGLAGLLRAGGGTEDMAARVGAEAGGAEGKRMLDTAGGGAAASDEFAADAAAADPEVVVRDLGDVGDATTLAAALDAPSDHPTTRSLPATGQGNEDLDADGTSTDPAVAAPTGAAAQATVGPPDRARCRADAERIGAGRLGALLTTATLRWAGQPAEVLVFSLQEPAGGFSRQALVLARPGCGLLADPRW